MVLTPNSQHNHLCKALQAQLQEALQHGVWITFALQDTKNSCHAAVKVMEVMESNASN